MREAGSSGSAGSAPSVGRKDLSEPECNCRVLHWEFGYSEKLLFLLPQRHAFPLGRHFPSSDPLLPRNEVRGGGPRGASEDAQDLAQHPVAPSRTRRGTCCNATTRGRAVRVTAAQNHSPANTKMDRNTRLMKMYVSDSVAAVTTGGTLICSWKIHLFVGAGNAVLKHTASTTALWARLLLARATRATRATRFGLGRSRTV